MMAEPQFLADIQPTEMISDLFAHRKEYFPHIQVRGFRDGTYDDLGDWRYLP